LVNLGSRYKWIYLCHELRLFGNGIGKRGDLRPLTGGEFPKNNVQYKKYVGR
jgi:hypothetical protein